MGHPRFTATGARRARGAIGQLQDRSQRVCASRAGRSRPFRPCSQRAHEIQLQSNACVPIAIVDFKRVLTPTAWNGTNSGTTCQEFVRQEFARFAAGQCDLGVTDACPRRKHRRTPTRRAVVVSACLAHAQDCSDRLLPTLARLEVVRMLEFRPRGTPIISAFSTR